MSKSGSRSFDSARLALSVLFALHVLAGIAYCRDSRVFRVKDANGRLQTGFRVVGGSGIVTALHGVVHEPLTAKSVSASHNDLRIVFADVKHDVAIISSAELNDPATEKEGFKQTQNWDWQMRKGTEVTITGYPLQIHRTDITGTLDIRKGDPHPPLADIVNPETLIALTLRGSPSPEKKVLSLQGTIAPGHSGSPICDEKGNVVAVANGSLKDGSPGFAWAIPFDAITWRKKQDIEDELTRLQTLDVAQVFQKSASPTVEIAVLAEQVAQGLVLVHIAQLNRNIDLDVLNTSLNNAKQNLGSRLGQPIIRSYVAIADATLAIAEKKYDAATGMVSTQDVISDSEMSDDIASRVGIVKSLSLSGKADLLEKEGGELEAVIELYRRAIDIQKQWPQDAKARLTIAVNRSLMALVLMKSQDYNSAIEELNAALTDITKMSNNKVYLPFEWTQQFVIITAQTRAIAYSRNEDFEKCKRDIDTVISYVNRLISSNELTDAKKLQWLKTLKTAHETRGFAHRELGNQPEAVEDLAKAVMIDLQIQQLSDELGR